MLSIVDILIIGGLVGGIVASAYVFSWSSKYYDHLDSPLFKYDEEENL